MIKALLIQALLRQLLDPATRQAIARAVDWAADEDIPGAKKREQAIAYARDAGVDAAQWALNLAVELLVARLRV